MSPFRKKSAKTVHNTEVIIREPPSARLQKVWLHQVDSLLKYSIVFSFLLQFGALLMGKNWVIKIDSNQFETIYLGAFLWVVAFFVWMYDIRRKRKKMVEPSEDLVNLERELTKLEKKNVKTQSKLDELERKMGQIED